MSYMLLYPLLRVSCPDIDFANQPSLLRFAGGLLVCAFADDFFFYWVHRLLHTPFFYNRIHKIHHQ